MSTTYSYEELDVCYLANGTKYSIPIHKFEGPGSDKVVGVGAAIHGDEIIGVEIARRVVEFLKTQEVHGTIKICSVAHSLSFEQVDRNSPIDGLNLNRVFPGSEDGFLTERIANVYLEKFVGTLDAYLDVHSGGREPIVEYCYILNDEAMSRAFGSKILYRPTDDYPGNVNNFAKEKGVRSMVAEIGGLAVRERDVQRGVDGVLSVLRHEGVIDGEEIKRDDQVVCDYIAHIDPHEGGLMVPGLDISKLGEIVEGHVTLAKIYNPKTLELLEEIKAPYERNLMILLRPTVNRAFPGDFSFMIADADALE
ncbi:MAG: succinylglutamate desuccinylase/aspartoacylase family protein [Eubacteriales bacterium]|nr:succinylglutamate desuccinylase/aspartoacylase family protein [Eubacteriales bacterium]